MRCLTYALAIVLLLCFPVPQAYALEYSAFGQYAQGGYFHGQDFFTDPGGLVYEVDSFLRTAGMDASAPLSLSGGSIPFEFSFSTQLSDDGTDLTITYSFTNSTGADVSDVVFLTFFDAEIDELLNT